VYFRRPYWPKTQAHVDAKAVNNLLVYINHSINFFLYCVSGNRFRRMIIIVFHCPCLKPLNSSFDSLLDLRRTSLDTRLVYGITSILTGDVGGGYGVRGVGGDRRSPNGARKTSKGFEREWGTSANTSPYGTLVKHKSGDRSYCHAMLLMAHQGSLTPSPQTVPRLKKEIHPHKREKELNKRATTNSQAWLSSSKGEDCYQMIDIHISDHDDSDYYSERRCVDEIRPFLLCEISSCSGDCITCSAINKTATDVCTGNVPTHPRDYYKDTFRSSNLSLKDFHDSCVNRGRRGRRINSISYESNGSTPDMVVCSHRDAVPSVVNSTCSLSLSACYQRDVDIKAEVLDEGGVTVFIEQETTY